MLRILMSILLAGAILGCSESKKDEAKYSAAIEQGNADAESAFKAWNASTAEGVSVVLWSGEASQILFIEDTPIVSGVSWIPGWIVWAQSSGGVIYKVKFFRDRELNMVPDISSPEITTKEALVKRLLSAGRMDVIEKLGIPIKIS